MRGCEQVSVVVTRGERKRRTSTRTRGRQRQVTESLGAPRVSKSFICVPYTRKAHLTLPVLISHSPLTRVFFSRVCHTPEPRDGPLAYQNLTHSREPCVIGAHTTLPVMPSPSPPTHVLLSRVYHPADTAYVTKSYAGLCTEY
jgi:hypothetical protein